MKDVNRQKAQMWERVNPTEDCMGKPITDAFYHGECYVYGTKLKNQVMTPRTHKVFSKDVKDVETSKPLCNPCSLYLKVLTDELHIHQFEKTTGL